MKLQDDLYLLSCYEWRSLTRTWTKSWTIWGTHGRCIEPTTATTISSEQAAQTLSDRRQHSELSHLKRSFSSRTCIPIRHKEQALTPVLLIEESLDVVWRFIYVLVTCDCACAELCSDNCFDMYWVFSWCVWRKFLLICIALYKSKK